MVVVKNGAYIEPRKVDAHNSVVSRLKPLCLSKKAWNGSCRGPRCLWSLNPELKRCFCGSMCVQRARKCGGGE